MDLSLFIDRIGKLGWKSQPPKDVPAKKHPILSKYDIPAELWEFWSSFSRLESADECTWFLFPDDYKEVTDPNEFAWNEFERISLEAALDDTGAAAVREWWSRHLPILMSVKGGYSFYAVDTVTKKIVHGFEPEFEEVTTAAESFTDLLDKIIKGEIVL